MLYVISNSYNPFYNLAVEEYFLKNSILPVFMLWRSEPSVIVGKHQNTLAEINLHYIIENNIMIARRLSGGGTVVHDMQNINFTFIANGEQGKLIDFKKFVLPIISYLNKLGIDARLGEKNEILIGDLKISGNAEHIYKNRILHHGTLLFNSDLDRLKMAIKTQPGKYIDKAVQSNRASVTNILSHLKIPLKIEDFTSGLSEFIMQTNANSNTCQITTNEQLEIERLVNERYNTIEWIYGYSPKYRFEKNFEFRKEYWKVSFEVEKGIIMRSSIFVDGKRFSDLELQFKNKFHLPKLVFEGLKNVLSSIDSNELKVLTFCFF